MDRRKAAAAMPSARVDVCTGPGGHAQHNDSIGRERQPRQRASDSSNPSENNAASTNVGGAAGTLRASPGTAQGDVAVTVLSAVDGREDVAQLTRRLAADATAPKGENSKHPSVELDEDFVTAQLRGNAILTRVQHPCTISFSSPSFGVPLQDSRDSVLHTCTVLGAADVAPPVLLCFHCSIQTVEWWRRHRYRWS